MAIKYDPSLSTAFTAKKHLLQEIFCAAHIEKTVLQWVRYPLLLSKVKQYWLECANIT